MTHSLQNLLDVPKLQELLHSLDRLHGPACAVLDAEGAVIASSGLSGICASFHHSTPAAGSLCLRNRGCLPGEADLDTASRCPMGLIEATTPIVVGGKTVGRVFTGQVFLDPPDEEDFRAQAGRLGFDEKEYLAALSRVPLCTENELRQKLEFVAHLTRTFAEQGLALQRQQECEEQHHSRQERLCEVVQRAKREWEETFDAVPDLISIIGTDHGIRRVNRAMADLLGVHPRDLVGKKCYEVLHRTDAPPPGCPAARAMESCTVEEGEFDEERLQRSFSVTASPILDSCGRVASCVHVARDITERRKKEEALTASERFLRAITDNIPGMVGYWDKDLRCGFANQAYQEWFGRDGREMLGMRIQELLGEELFKRNEPYMLRALEGETQRFERALVKADGSTGYTWPNYIPDVVDGSTRGFFVLVTDVTELKLAEEAKARLECQLQQAQKMESVGRLAGGVAHDFNNQLTVIMAYADMGLMGLDPSHPFYAMFQEIGRAAERSAGLTQQLLAFARQQPVTPKLLDLNDTVRDMLKMLRRLIGEQIHLTWRAAEEPCRVKMDPSQVDQILANLCINARDAVGDFGEIRIETGMERLPEGKRGEGLEVPPGDYVFLSVTDNGCGMDAATLQQIFEPFFTTKEVGKGTGLGLSTVYGVTRQNGGFIEVKSQAGRGTSFRIYLPRCREEAKAAQAAATRAVSGGKETILLVEDEPSILAMAHALLEQKGYLVLAARTPLEALALVADYPGEIHLLLTDVIMKQMNGRDLARELSARRPGVKCLYMSGYTADVIGHHGVMEDDVRFIAKPFKSLELAAKVREALEE